MAILVASEAMVASKADLKIELSDLNYLCSNASLTCKDFLDMMIDTMDATNSQL